MDFFERQTQVRRQSRLLVLYFIVAVVAVVAVVDLVILVAFTGFSDSDTATASDPVPILIFGAAVTLGLILTVSIVRSASLRAGGGGNVARQLGGVHVRPDTTDPQLRRLQNVVEEISIASGVSVPEVYVLQGESGINAFAAGHSPADAAIAVTSGALERLNRRELEGVIAHEFSHIVNGDMRLNIRLIGALFGIQVLAIVGRVMLQGGFYSGGGRSRGRGKGAGQIVLIGMAAMVIGYVGVLMGRLIKAAVSRQREYLADASAVEFTRQTEGLVGALKKIGGLPTGSELQHGKVDDVSHMLFGNGLRLSSMFATHPPLTKRIQVLDPTFAAAQLDALAQRWHANPPSGLAEDQALGLAGPEQMLPAPDASIAVQPQAVAASAANPSEATYQQAEALLAAIPNELRDRAHGQVTALGLVLGLLMVEDPPTRTHQHQVIVANLGQEVADAAWHDAGELATLHPALRLPLCEIAFPALRYQRDAGQLQAILTAIHAMIWVDGHVSVYEYCMARVLYRDLEEAQGHQEPRSSPRHTLAHSAADVATLLVVVAAAGHADPNAAQQAYQAGLTALGQPGHPGAAYPYAPPAEGVVALDGVWRALDLLSWHEKGRLVEGLMVVASHDRVVTVTEMELVRLVCSMLHCPLPPQLPALAPG